jgi:uncharacterized Zn finger protein
MSYYYGFRPYVSVAERRRQAQREMEKKRQKGLVVLPIKIDGRVIAKTFWGQAWCDNLESYSDFENRLPRGRTYVRNGSVVHLEVKKGRISAFVSGSELYSVEITIASLPQNHWKQIKSQCAGKIGSLIELLQARLSTSVMEVVTQRGEGLFPKPSEIKMKCSCPDWAGMCKHVAAVMYGVGARLDAQPDLLFLLREIDHLELIAGAVDAAPVSRISKGRGKKTIAANDLADVFGIEMAAPEPPAESESVSTQSSPAKPIKARGVTSLSVKKQPRTQANAGAKKPARVQTTAKAGKKHTTKTVKARSGRASSTEIKANSRQPAKQERS